MMKGGLKIEGCKIEGLLYIVLFIMTRDQIK